MKNILAKTIGAGMICFAAISCQSGSTANNDNNMNNTQATDTSSVKVEVETTEGNFTVLLYGDTPKHRDNFVKLAKEGYYDGTLFHRIIENFMVQAGDPDSKNAPAGKALGSGGPDYKIDAEIVFPKHFHKRYALAAARQGDQVNPMRQSSGSQFYVVTGTKLDTAQVAQIDQRLKMNRMQKAFNELAIQHRDSIQAMQQRGDRDGLNALQEKLVAQVEAQFAGDNVAIVTPEMKEAYTTVGGAPHLDGEYTVFGEVISGFETIDRIEKAETDGRDRPKEDIRITGMKVLDK